MEKIRKALKYFFSQMTTKEFALLQAVNLSKFIKSVCIMVINLILLVLALVVMENSFPDTFTQKLVLNIIFYYCLFMFFVNLGQAIKWGSWFSEWGNAIIYLLKSLLWMSFGLLDFSSSVSDIDNSGIGKMFFISIALLIFVIIVQKIALGLIKVRVFKLYDSAECVVNTKIGKDEFFQKVLIDEQWKPYIVEYTKKVINTTVFSEEVEQVTGDVNVVETLKESLLVSFKMRYSDIEFGRIYPIQIEGNNDQNLKPYFVNENQLEHIFEEVDLKKDFY